MSDIDPDERELLRSTARAIFAGQPETAALGELGFLGLLTPEGLGGSGDLIEEACIVAIEGGRALAPHPWLGTLLAAAALSLAPEHHDLVGRLVAGDATGAFLERSVTVDGAGNVTAELVMPGTVRPDVMVLVSNSQPLLMIDLAGGGTSIAVEAESIDSSRGSQRVLLTGAHALEVPGGAAAYLSDASTLLNSADSLGALAATTERMITYLSSRNAFGHPLASFQVLQHRLVDLDMLVAQAGALIHEAARALSEGAGNAGALVGMLQTFFADRCVAALDDCIQLSGGIGVTWEWPVHHALRRAVVNGAARQPTTLSADELRTALADARPVGPLSDPYRERIRTAIAEAGAPHPREGHKAPESLEQQAALRTWYRYAFDNGLSGASWPVEWGGDEHFEPANQLVITEELIRADVPRPIDQVSLAAHVLLHFGTPEQKALYLPRIRNVDDIWCQLFSEPGAGSDLAGVTTRAEQRADGSWVISGQKTWSTDAHWAQLGLAVVRTSQESRRHEGLTVFIVPLDAPGVEIHPIPMLNQAHDINTVFLDGVVLGPEHVIGAVGQGWAVAMSGLEIERLGVGGNVVLLEMLLDNVIALAAALEVSSPNGTMVIDDVVVRSDIQRLVARFVATRAFVSGHIDRVLADTEGVGEASIAKIVYTEAYNEIARYGVGLIEKYGPEPTELADIALKLRDSWLWSRVLTISGGSSEINRNILAKRRLRLPSA